MGKLLLEKKGHLNVVQLALGIAGSVLWLWLIQSTDMMRTRYGDGDFEKFMRFFGPVAALTLCLMPIFIAFLGARTKISIYSDHIEGAGLAQNLRLQSFYYPVGMQYTVQQERRGVVVSCNGTSHTVILTPGDAQEVYHCATGFGGTQNPVFKQTPPSKSAGSQPNPGAYQQNTGNHAGGAGNPKGTTIAYCPRCGAKCRVPAGVGKIRITCPNPNCQSPFLFDT